MLASRVALTGKPTFFSEFPRLARHTDICGAYLFVFALKWKQNVHNLRHFTKQRLADNFDSKAWTSVENYSYEYVLRMNVWVGNHMAFKISSQISGTQL
jgi:hypothetical protein